MKKKAFTLIELTIVLLIVSIAAGIVIMKMSGPISRAKLQDVIECLKKYDNDTRSYAYQHGKSLQVEIDLSSNLIRRLDEDENLIGREFVLINDFTIQKFRVMSAQNDEDNSEKSFFKKLKYSRQGLSRSYAIKLDDKKHSRWVFFIGLTGEVMEIEDDEQVQEIFEIF